MKTRHIAPLLLIAAVGGLTANAASQSPATQRPRPRGTALVGGLLIGAAGGPPVRNSVVLIRGDRIEKVGTVASLPVPSGYESISTEGMAVLPGLWDMHVHLIYNGHPNVPYWFKYASRFERVTNRAAPGAGRDPGLRDRRGQPG